ncbi:10926_t:CDS:2 [Diversispora eburnea]|uniref:10926_t:CDS:1 n=1 Tax=Diversispora eburnea TaxID=1213867 RepID=A0A9N8V3M4_9GLOM|nr:10926_t:CDS:2 [Diversispora eburnea]
MVKKYYCDYCDRSFPDNIEARRKHLEGTQHKNKVKQHYDSFKDPVELLIENSKKSRCRKFFEFGYCPFGLSCKYSHVPVGFDFSIIDPHMYLAQNPHLLPQQNFRGSTSKENTINTKMIQPRQQLPIFKYKFPTGFPKDLPPSLRPPPSTGYDYSSCSQW